MNKDTILVIGLMAGLSTGYVLGRKSLDYDPFERSLPVTFDTDATNHVYPVYAYVGRIYALTGKSTTVTYILECDGQLEYVQAENVSSHSCGANIGITPKYFIQIGQRFIGLHMDPPPEIR